jgi:drug/metabolite transporter (DMT)-like permease
MIDNPQSLQANPVLPIAALVLGAVAMGASPIFVRLADVGPFSSAFWRMALAIPFLWGWLKFEASRSGSTVRALNKPSDAKLIIWIGFLFAGDLFFWHLSIMNTSIANATLLATTTPIAVTLGAWLLLKEKITGPILIGVLSGVAGAGLLVGASATFAPENVMGDVSGLITAAFFGTYFLSLSYARRSMSSAQVMFYPAIVTAGFLLIAALLLDDGLFPQSLEGWATLGALAIISQIAGQGFAAYALGHLPAVFSSLVLFFEVLAAALLAWLIFAEPVSVWQLGGGILILAGIYVARPRKIKHQAHS